MSNVFLEIAASLRELEDTKKKTIEEQYKLLSQKKQKLEQAAKSFFEAGTRGFRPRPSGNLRTKGLDVSDVRKKKNKIFVVFWHRLANLYHNFKERRQVKWLNIIQRRLRRDA